MEPECIEVRSVDTPSDTLVSLPFGLELGVEVVVRVYVGMLGFALAVWVVGMNVLLSGWFGRGVRGILRSVRRPVRVADVHCPLFGVAAFHQG